MSRTYRVIVCGIGGIGVGAVRECVRLPWIKIVGAQVWSEQKDGVDIGTLAGLEPIGVTATTDVGALSTVEADCVLFCARDLGDHASDRAIIRWLESGRNVITPLPYVYPKTRGPEVVARLQAAAERGRATLAGAGLNPGWISERLTLLLTGLSHDIERIDVTEAFDMSAVPEEFSRAFGVGLPADDADRSAMARELLNQYLPPTISYVCDAMEVEIDRIEQSHRFTTAEQDYPLPAGYTLKRGTVAMMTSRWTALHHGEPFFVLEGHWYADAALLEEPRLTAGSWTIRIEGRPSVQVVLDINASMDRSEPMIPGDPVPPGYYATVNVMLGLLPATCDARPGILTQPSIGPHYSATQWSSASAARA
jgi:2,4-diaminopentanoate dehydrogenase